VFYNEQGLRTFCVIIRSVSNMVFIPRDVRVRNTTGTTIGTETDYSSRSHEFTSCFSCGSCSFVICV